MRCANQMRSQLQKAGRIQWEGKGRKRWADFWPCAACPSLVPDSLWPPTRRAGRRAWSRLVNASLREVQRRESERREGLGRDACTREPPQDTRKSDLGFDVQRPDTESFYAAAGRQLSTLACQGFAQRSPIVGVCKLAPRAVRQGTADGRLVRVGWTGHVLSDWQREVNAAGKEGGREGGIKAPCWEMATWNFQMARCPGPEAR